MVFQWFLRTPVVTNLSYHQIRVIQGKLKKYNKSRNKILNIHRHQFIWMRNVTNTTRHCSTNNSLVNICPGLKEEMCLCPSDSCQLAKSSSRWCPSTSRYIQLNKPITFPFVSIQLQPQLLQRQLYIIILLNKMKKSHRVQEVQNSNSISIKIICLLYKHTIGKLSND